MTKELFLEKIKSTNFLMALILFVGGTMVAFPQEAAIGGLTAILGLVGVVGTFRVYFKNAQFDIKAWAKNANTYNYLATIVTLFVPALTPEFFTVLQETIGKALDGNWQGVAVSLFSLITIAYNVFKK